MSYQLLNEYIERLPRGPSPESRIWLDAQGCVQGRYFDRTLTSVFQPLRLLSTSTIVGYDTFTQSSSVDDPHASVWELQDGAASNAHCVELDRLCRLLHAINFWRQSGTDEVDLYMRVHERLLAAVAGDHGVVFRRMLAGLGLPIGRIVLQLPPVGTAPTWLPNQVAANYRRNGFRVALTATSVDEGLRLLQTIHPDAIKLNVHAVMGAADIEPLASACKIGHTKLVFERVESELEASRIYRMRGLWDFVYAQGGALGLPSTTIESDSLVASPAPLQQVESDSKVTTG